MKNDNIPIILVTISSVFLNCTLGLIFPSLFIPILICTALILLIMALP